MPKPIDDRIAALKAKKEKLAAQLNTLQAKSKVADRKRDTRRKIIIGGAVLAALEKDRSIAPTVTRFLAAHVTRPKDREVIADLLAPSTARPEVPANSSTGKSWMQNLGSTKDRR
jgi:hypothetical protein